MKKLVIPLAILVMLLLLAAAVAWDSVRYAADARGRVQLADEEVKKQEVRLVKILSESDKTSEPVKAAIAAYERAESPQARRDAYQKLAGSFSSSMSSAFDPTNPLDRKVADEVVGSFNRHQVAVKAYDNESAEYQHFLSGFRGRIAKMFSSQASADGNASF